MRKYYQFFGLALIMVFSFYYTERIASIVLNKNPLMMEIKNEANNYNIKSVNAEIKGNYIIPGINGMKVNYKESFYKMQNFNTFNKYYLVFDQQVPEISLKDNKDKIIKKGNSKYKRVAFIFREEGEISNYFVSNNIKASLLVNLDNYKRGSFLEVINNESDNFNSLDNALNLNKENKHICVLNDYNKDVCIKHQNFLIEPTDILKSNNLSSIRKNIENGSIILVSEEASLSDVLFILKEVKYKDMELVYLSELISEENNG